MTKPAPQKLGGRIIVIAVLLLMNCFLIQAQTGVVMQSSFETSNVKAGFQVLEGCCSYSLTQSTTEKRSGQSSMRVELRKTDPEAQYGNKRAELTYNNYSTQSAINTNLRWYALSTYFPSATYKQDPAEESFTQWHDKSPNCSTSPPLSIHTKDGRYRAIIIYSLTDYCSNPNFVQQTFDLGPIAYDQWNDWVINYNPQYNSSGYVKIWLNGKQVLNYSGPCFYNGSWFPYWKVGIYKWLWMGSGSKSTTDLRVYYTDDVKVGDNTASESTFVSGGSTTPTNQSPTADAGADLFITLPTNTVTLNGANSKDIDGSIATYKWSQVSGPNTASFANSSASSTAASNLVQGTYVFRLTVTDDKGATATNDVSVNVAASTTVANKAPVVNAGSNKSITLPTNSTGLSGSATDADGTIKSYLWNQVSGPNTATFSTTTTATPTVSALVAGTYSFKLTATDDKAATGSSTVSVTVNAAAANQAPVANAGSAKTITLPTNSTSLSGSGTDADGTISSYKWSQVSGPNTATFSSTTTAAATVSALVAGTYTFKLTVTDNKGATASANVNVTVNAAAAANQAPVANAGTAKTITLPTNSASLSGSGTDADGTISSYKWSQVSGPNTATFSSTTTAAATVSALVAGTYTFRLTVTDNKGATASANVNVTVNAAAAANQAPVANAGTAKTITLPTNSTSLSGSGTDADGTISSYKWSQVSGPNTATFSSTTTAAATVSALVAGTYTFRLTVTDNKGATASANVNVTVNAAAAANQAPVANAGTAKTITLPTNSTSLSGSGTDADGTISSYKWSQVSGPNTATFSSTTTAAATVSALVAGTYTFRLTVTDNKGATASANVNVTVNAAPVANQAPVANAGSNISITLPTSSTTLSGSGTDADGTISSYKWNEISGPNTVTASSTTTASITISGLIAGTYTFRLTVTDNKGATGTANVSVTVSAASSTNKAPVANAGTPKTVTLPVNSVQLSSQSYDPDGKISVYAWSQVSGPNTANFNNKASSMPTVSNLVAGTYTFKLDITDDKGAKASATTTVTVNKAAAAAVKQAPIARTVGKQTLIGTSVSLNGADSYDTDGTIASYSWTQVSGPTSASLANADKATAQASRLATGTYVFQLEVIDNDGMKGTANLTLEVTADAAGNAPVARAGNDQTIIPPATAASLDGSASSDPNGTIAAYAWTIISGPGAASLGTASVSKTQVNGLTEGVYTIQLKVTDSEGLTDMDTIVVTVKNSPTNLAPVAMTNNDFDLTVPVESVVLDGSQSYDTDGKITLYQWKLISGANSAKIENGNSAQATVSKLKPGVYVFELTVKDDKGALGTKDITVTIRDANGNAFATALRTYPNPAHSTMTLRLDDASSGKASVRIYSMSGVVLLTDDIQKDNTTFMKVYDLSSLPGGSYLISVQFDGKPAITKKIQKL